MRNFNNNMTSQILSVISKINDTEVLELLLAFSNKTQLLLEDLQRKKDQEIEKILSNIPEEKIVHAKLPPHLLISVPEYDNLVYRISNSSICPVQWDDPENQKGERFFIYNGVRYNLDDMICIGSFDCGINFDMIFDKEFHYAIADRIEFTSMYDDVFNHESPCVIPIRGIFICYEEESEFEDNEVEVWQFELISK